MAGKKSDKVGGEKMEERQIAVFTLGKEEYGVAITAVKEIIKTPASTRLPNVPDFIEGIINLRGEIIPVIDLRKRFGMEALECRDEESRVIVLEIAGQTVGVIVDEVTEVLKIPEEAVEEPPEFFSGKNSSILEGIGKLDQRLLILLHPDPALLSPDLDKEQFRNLREDLRKIAGSDLS